MCQSFSTAPGLRSRGTVSNRPGAATTTSASTGCTACSSTGCGVSARLQPGGTDVGGGWREQLENDVAPLLEDAPQVWLRADKRLLPGRVGGVAADSGEKGQ